jgi:hypothetical protein
LRPTDVEELRIAHVSAEEKQEEKKKKLPINNEVRGR